MQRFFLPELQPAVDEVVSLAPIHKQLRHVLRVQPGMQLVVLDNQGNERLMEVVTTGRPDTTARVVEMRDALAEPAVAVDALPVPTQNGQVWVGFAKGNRTRREYAGSGHQQPYRRPSDEQGASSQTNALEHDCTWSRRTVGARWSAAGLPRLQLCQAIAMATRVFACFLGKRHWGTLV